MSEWVEAEKLPESGQFVLAVVEHGRTRSILRALYAHRFELENRLDDEGGEYDEATDEWYVDPGWYECNAFDEVHWAIDGTVTHWMPLPPLPENPAQTLARGERDGR